MQAKTLQLQIRVSPDQKATLQRLAHAAGLDVSSYVLRRVVPAEREQFAQLIQRLASGADSRYGLAELNDFLHACPPISFADAVADEPLGTLSRYLANYVAAMVELAAHQKGVAPPPWVRNVAPLDVPHFVTTLQSLRLHLLSAAPVPFKRRNIFVDSSIGDRV